VGQLRADFADFFSFRGVFGIFLWFSSKGSNLDAILFNSSLCVFLSLFSLLVDDFYLARTWELWFSCLIVSLMLILRFPDCKLGVFRIACSSTGRWLLSTGRYLHRMHVDRLLIIVDRSRLTQRPCRPVNDFLSTGRRSFILHSWIIWMKSILGVL
jgi:hypothetical protein